MKHSPIAVGISLIFLTSCTKTIEVDLNNSSPQYVVEGNIVNGENKQTVRITRSVNYSDESKYPAVTNATVIISDDADHIDTLAQEVPGYYVTDRMRGVPGHTYTLRIIVDGREFRSSSTMPEEVQIKTFHLENKSSFGEDIKAPVVVYQDPPGIRNYLYFVIYRNDVRLKTIFLENDLVNDGTVVNTSLLDPDATYSSGDKVKVEMRNISSLMYDYYFSLQQTISQSSATPTNPISNITGEDVLGYFSAQTIQEQALIIP